MRTLAALALAALAGSAAALRATRSGHDGAAAGSRPHVVVLSSYLERLHNPALDASGVFSGLREPVERQLLSARRPGTALLEENGFLFKKKNAVEEEVSGGSGSSADNTDAEATKASQKGIEELSKQVKEAENAVMEAAGKHATLAEKLEKMKEGAGHLAKVQTTTWHGQAYSYSPKKDSWLTLPYWNKYACAVGVVTGPGGHCHRTLGATLTGCGAKPDEKILATTATYKSDTCQCDACSGFSGGMVAAPYCHSRGLINTCHCMLVDNAIDNENSCLSLE